MSAQYQLGGGNLSGARLNLQHSFTQEIFSNHLIDPSIPIPSTNLHIADVCTGTGIWLLQAANLHSHAHCDGLDINLAETPHSSWLPANIHFHKFDIFAPVPDEFIGKYDLINIQYTMLFVTDKTISSVLTKLISMLKPNGWLQYTEYDAMNKRILMPPCTSLSQAPPTAPPESISNVVPAAWSMISYTPPTWPARLSILFTSARLVSVHQQTPDPPLSTYGPIVQNHLLGIEEGCASALMKGMSTKDVTEAVLEKVSKAWKEHRETGAVIDLRITRCVGKRA